MTPRTHRRLIVTLFVYVAALLSLPSPARAEDIDIFTINPSVSGLRPNVLIILDTSSNWASTDKLASTPGNSVPKFINVRKALADTLEGFTEVRDVLDSNGNVIGTETIVHPGLDDRFNLGLMMYAETGGGVTVNDTIDGGVLRKSVRQLTPANKQAFINFFRNVDGNFDQSNNTSMGLAFHEAFLYFTGRTGFSGVGKIKRDYPHSMPSPCTGPQNANSNCSLQFSNNLWNLALDTTEPPLPANALSSSGSRTYNKPMTDACQKNFIIYIGNGTVTDPNSSNVDATTKLAALGGNTTQIVFTQNDGDQGNISDEWTRFLATRPDVTDPTVVGNQKIVTYTVEVNMESDNQGLANHELLKSMAFEGKGKHFDVTTAGGGAEIADALNKIFAEILSVNSVFAASTLPVSVNVRGAFLNQVYMGVFRPDANSSPRWPGNVKQYKLAATTSGSVFLADKNGTAIENTSTGFVGPSVVSFWSTPTTFWDTTYYPDVKTELVAATSTDSPDGEFVEKGGAAQHLRTVHATDVTTRKLYTCISGICGANENLSGSANHEFVSSNTNITDTMLGVSAAKPVTSLTRSGTLATAKVTGHGFADQSVVKIDLANQPQYNKNFNITRLDADTFTFTVADSPVSPATTATSILAAKGSGPVDVTTLTRSGTTATANAAGHTFTNTQTITITGANPSDPTNSFNGSKVISGVVAGVSFQYAVAETPVSPATVAGTAKVGTVTKNIKSTPSVGVTRSGTTVTIETTNPHGFSAGQSVTIAGVTPNEYNGSFSISTISSTNNKVFTYTLPSTSIGPASPATGTIRADPATTKTIATNGLTRSGTTARAVTTTTHGYSTNDFITISGANETEYNGTFQITVVDTTTFTYTVPVNPASPATPIPGITATGSGGVTKTELVDWVRGANIQLDDNPNITPTASATRVRAYLHGDVLHSRPAVINYNRAGQPADRDLVVYYGANDGVVHAVKGGQNDADGTAKWGFIPTEFYDRFVRLFLQDPIISTSVPRTYFADGSISVDAVYVNDRMEGAGAKAQIYIGMRRGGRFYYSLDVTSPDAPVYKWKITNTTIGFAELGQSWSDARVVKVRLTTCPGTADLDGNCKVLVFGAGNDAAANDPATQGTATMGRGIFVVDAATGALIWHTSPVASGSVTMPVGATYVQTSGMDFAIPADLAVINSDLDNQNLADRIYAADTGGNIWRVNISDPDPGRWGVAKVASLGGSGANARKFLFSPDTVAFDSTTDSILVGTGDREHPFDTTIANRFYMIKDSHGMTDLPGTAATESDLCNLTANQLQGTDVQAAADASACLADSAKKGWMVQLATGEKTVTGATTLGGTTIFATNTPTSVSTPGSCTGPLGKALIYAVDFKDATATIDFNHSGTVTQGERATERIGGGFPPTAIPFTTQIGDKFFEGAITGTQVVQPPSAPVGQRYRVFWNLSVDN